MKKVIKSTSNIKASTEMSKYYLKEVKKAINRLEAALGNVDSDTYNDLDLQLLEDEMYEASRRIGDYLDK